MLSSSSLLPVVPGSGFAMEGYYVWCGSAWYENGKYYLFAARWPEKNGFPDGYMFSSEIVLAETEDLPLPFRFVKVVLPGRGGNHWDGKMTHNPLLIKYKGKYVLFYIGTPDGKPETRAIGYAVSDTIDGDYLRCDEPLALPPNANNPAVLVEKDRILLCFRDGNLEVSIAEAKELKGPYTILNPCLFSKGRIEDMFLYRTETGYEMLAEDADGAYTGLQKGGVCFTSKDGIHWDGDTATTAYTFDVSQTDGTSLHLQRRERPMLLTANGRTCLFTTAKIGGATLRDGGHTWNMVQAVSPER